MITIAGLAFLGYRDVKQGLNTTDWKIYTNSGYGIELKYPREFKIASERKFEKSIDFTLVNEEAYNKQIESQSKTLPSYPVITIHFIKNDIIPVTGLEAGDYGKPEQITVGGQTAYKKNHETVEEYLPRCHCERKRSNLYHKVKIASSLRSSQ